MENENNKTPELFPDDLNKKFEVEKQFIELRAAGCTIQEIAKKLKKSKHTIINWNKKYFNEIKEIKNAELCDLQFKIVEQKRNRIEILNEQFDKIISEMEEEKVGGWYSDKLALALKLVSSLDKSERYLFLAGLDENKIYPKEREIKIKVENATGKKKEHQNCTKNEPTFGSRNVYY